MRVCFSAASMLCVLGLAASAQASLFSFASDSNPSGFTFCGTAGSGGGFTITNDQQGNIFKLVIDDNNGSLPSFTLDVNFEANMSAAWVATTPIAGPTVLHSYSVTNAPGGYAFRFRDLSNGQVLLTASLDGGSEGVFSMLGTGTSWSSAGAIRASDTFANVRYTASQALVDRIVSLGRDPGAYGINVGDSVALDDFGFDLTLLGLVGTNGTVSIDAQTRLPTAAWKSEGSFSGSAVNGIPGPASAALIGIAGLIIARRRREL